MHAQFVWLRAEAVEHKWVKRPLIFIGRVRELCITLANLVEIETHVIWVYARDKWSIAQGPLVVDYNRTNVRHDVAGQFQEIPDLSIENVSGLFDRNADSIERALGG